MHGLFRLHRQKSHRERRKAPEKSPGQQCSEEAVQVRSGGNQSAAAIEVETRKVGVFVRSRPANAILRVAKPRVS